VGSGFKTFSPGDVLTASDVNNFLMEQSVMSFADAAARTSAIGTANFEEGMVSYLQNTDKIQVYNGTAWVDAANNTGAGLIHINTTTFSAVASQSFSDVFTSTYDHYKLILQLTNVSGIPTNVGFRMRTGSTDNTSSYQFAARGLDTGGASEDISSNSANAGYFFNNVSAAANLWGAEFVCYNPKTVLPTLFTFTVGGIDAGGNWFSRAGSILHNTGTSFESLTLLTSGGTISGTLSVYGFRKS
jgi:hypothetical protein